MSTPAGDAARSRGAGARERRGVLGCLLAVLLVVSGTALAQPVTPKGVTAEQLQRANELGKEGDALFKDGRFREALEKYDAAYELAPAPVLLWNRARCREEVGHLKAAVELYEEFLVSSAPVARRKVAAKKIHALEKRIASTSKPPVEPPPTDHATPVVGTGEQPPVTVTGQPEPPPVSELSRNVLRINGLMMVVVAPTIEYERAVSQHFSFELGLAFGIPASGRGFGLGATAAGRWYPIQRAPDGWFVELVALAGGEPGGSTADTAGALFGVSTGYQFLAWDTLALGAAAGPGVLVSSQGALFFPALRADVGVAF